MNDNISESRVEVAKRYLEEHHKMLDTSWPSLYRKYKKGELSKVQEFSLINPDHFRELVNVRDVLGNRSFNQDLVIESIDCQSRKMWGYDCNVQERSHVGMNADHLFPYSLGGPTLGGNKIYLCSVHNEMKGNDIHLYPWEAPTPEWLQQIISSIHHFLK